MGIIKLKELEWDNMYSFGPGNKLNLEEEQLNQITAPNGFGKSSIPLIIEEILYNKNSKGVAKSEIANRFLGTSYNASLTFSKDGIDYKISIKRSGATIKAILLRNGEDISSHTTPATYKELESIFGIDFKTFQQLVYQNTSNSLQFLEATDTTRKKFLISLFDMTEYTEYHEMFKKELSLVDSELKDIKSKTSALKSSIDKLKISVSNKPTLLEKVVPDAISEEEVGVLKTNIANLKTTRDRVDKLLAINKELATLEDHVKLAESKLESKNKEDLSKVQADIGKVQAGASAASSMLSKLRTLKDECPTCLQRVDSGFKESLVTEYSKILTESSELYNDLNAKVMLIRNKNQLVDNYTAAHNKLELAKARAESMNTNDIPASYMLMPTTDDLELALSNLQKDIANNKRAIAEALEYNNKVRDSIVKYNTHKEQLSELLVQQNNIVKDLPELEQKVKDLTVLKDAFGTNGLIAYKLENMVKDLEELSNSFLSKLSSGRFVLEFRLEGEKLNVILFDQGKEISVASPSSGERARINISILLAIRSLMSSISKNTINVLFLDEVISVLDTQGLEMLVEVLLEEHSLNTYLVAHSWSHPLVKSISISKDARGISRIRQ